MRRVRVLACVVLVVLAACAAPSVPGPDVEVACETPPVVTGEGGVEPLALTCARAIAAARGVLDRSLVIDAFEFGYGRWCSLENLRACPRLSVDEGHVIAQLATGERLVVGVSLAADGSVAADEPWALPAD